MKDYCAILGVPRNATPEQIKSAFRSKAKEFHPDKNPDNPHADEQMAQINEAYSVLSDDDKRYNYDGGYADSDVSIQARGAIAAYNYVQEAVTAISENDQWQGDDVDLVKVVSSRIRQIISNNKKTIEAREKRVAMLSKVLDRVVNVQGEDNLFNEAAQSEIDSTQQTIAMARTKNLELGEALLIVKGYIDTFGQNRLESNSEPVARIDTHA